MKKILYAKPSITQLEIDYVNDAVANGWGEHCYDYIYRFKDLLKEYYGIKYVFPTSSCHGALHISLAALGIGPGDEVIVPDITWTGSIFPISWLGATPVFVDILEDTWCIDPKEIEKAISERTKAIIVVHLYGNLVEMDEVIELGEKYSIPIVEDAAEAIGSKYKGKLAGSIGDIGIFSYHGTKTITTGEGGSIITNHEELAFKISTLENQGRRSDCKKMFWVDEIGYKYKMSNIQAALGCAQMERVEELVENKRKVFFLYKEAFSKFDNFQMNIEQDYVENSYWMPTIIISNYSIIKRDYLIQQLNDLGISIRPFFYPVSSLPMYKKKDNPNSYNIFKKGINVPNYVDLTNDNIQFIAKNLIENI